MSSRFQSVKGNNMHMKDVEYVYNYTGINRERSVSDRHPPGS